MSAQNGFPRPGRREFRLLCRADICTGQHIYKTHLMPNRGSVIIMPRTCAAFRCLPLALALGTISQGWLVAQVAPSAAPGVTKLPSIIVTAQKEAQPLENTPVSMTAATRSFIEDSGIRYVNDAAMFAPNTVLTEFSARKLSNPRFRGIGASPNN